MCRLSPRRARASHAAEASGVEPKQLGDVLLGAEAPAADADAVLVPEDRCDQPVVEIVDREGDDPKSVDGQRVSG